MKNILEVKNLRKSYGDFTLQDVSFSLPKGYIMGFVGPNGAGKTTTIKLIMNLLAREAGEVKIFGLDNQEHEKEVKRKIGFVYEDLYYNPGQTAEEARQAVKRFYPHWRDEEFDYYMDKFDLPADKKIFHLSQGMKMKLGLALALSHEAELLIMDEPTSGLDPVMRNELLTILQEEIQDENKGVLFSTHITSDLDKVADYITFIDQGEIIMSKEKPELLNKYALIKGKKKLLPELEGKEFVVNSEEKEFNFTALVADRAKAEKQWGEEIIIEQPTVEDILLYHME